MSDQNESGSKSQTNDLLLSILENAMNSSARFGESKGELETKKCPNCSAARSEGTELQFCDFCGNPFY